MVTAQLVHDGPARLDQLSAPASTPSPAELLAAAGEAIVAVDERLVVTAWNQAAERMYGWSAAEAVGQPVGELLCTELAGGGLDAVVRGLRESGVFTGEVRQRTRDGRELWVELTGRPLRDRSGRPAGLVLVNRDVTDRREAEMARERAEDDLRRAQRLDALGQLAAGVAHDFNNLLTAIRGYAELLSVEIGCDLHRRDLAEIVKAAERGADLTARLLELARAEPPALGSVNLVALVSGLEPLLRRTLEERVELVLELDPATPPVVADERQLEHVILNLAVNARDAMPHGGRLTVSVDTRPDLGGGPRTPGSASPTRERACRPRSQPGPSSPSSRRKSAVGARVSVLRWSGESSTRWAGRSRSTRRRASEQR